MKNFKLLLASTAILSTGAMIVNASSLRMEAYVGFLESLTITHIRPLSFGRIVDPQDGEYITFRAGEWHSSRGNMDEGSIQVSTSYTTDAGGDVGSSFPVQTGAFKVQGAHHNKFTRIAAADRVEMKIKGLDVKCGLLDFTDIIPSTNVGDEPNATYYEYGASYKVDLSELRALGNIGYELSDYICYGSAEVTLFMEQDGWGSQSVELPQEGG